MLWPIESPQCISGILLHDPSCLVLDIKRIKGHLEAGYHLFPGFLIVWNSSIVKLVKPSFQEWLSPSFAHFI